VEKIEHLHPIWEIKLVQLLQKILCRFLKNLKSGLPYDLATPLLGIYVKFMR
jgi:hypothetical protein